MIDPKLVYNGKVCKYGHGTERWRTSGGCIKCTNWRAQNRRQENVLYGTWASMLQRCYNRKNHNYKYYGGRGITVWEPWRRSFKRFATDIIALIGLPPSPQHTLDRIDNNGPYAPGNLRWATPSAQVRNSRHTKITLEDAQLIQRFYIQGNRRAGDGRFQKGNRTELAERFGLSKVQISCIAKGLYWKK